MGMPRWIMLLGFAGLAPFIAGPLLLTVAPDRAPAQLDHLWLVYAGLIASFMSGTFWGFALPAVQGDEGMTGIIIASLLMIATWASMILPFHLALYGLAGVFILLLVADVWRDRTLDSIDGYFQFRSMLTVGTLVCIAWRLWLHPGAAA